MNNRQVARQIMQKVANHRQGSSQIDGLLKEAYLQGVSDGMEKAAADTLELPEAPAWGDMSNKERAATAALTGAGLSMHAGVGGTAGAAIGILTNPEKKLKGALVGGLAGAIGLPAVVEAVRVLSGGRSTFNFSKSIARNLRDEYWRQMAEFEQKQQQS